MVQGSQLPGYAICKCVCSFYGSLKFERGRMFWVCNAMDCLVMT